MLEFDRDPDAPAFKIGTKVSRIGAAARVLEEQKPVFIPDSSQEMLNHPELAPFAAEVVGRTAYLLPVSTAQKRYGFLSVTKLQGEEFAPEDVECSVLWRRTLRSRSSALWQGTAQSCTSDKW